MRNSVSAKRRLFRAASAAGLLLLAAALSFGQEGYNSSTSGRWTLGLSLGGGVPAGEFMTEVGHAGFSLDLSLGRSIHNSPLYVGFDVCWVLYGIHTHDEYLSSTIPLEVQVETTNNILQGLFFLKLQPRRGRIRPYVEALAGVSYLFTETSIYDKSDLGGDALASDVNFDDLTLAAGGGAGVEIRLGKRPTVASGWGRVECLLDFKVRYVAGGRAQYLREDSIVYDRGTFNYLYRESTTNLFHAQVGIVVNF